MRSYNFRRLSLFISIAVLIIVSAALIYLYRSDRGLSELTVEQPRKIAIQNIESTAEETADIFSISGTVNFAKDTGKLSPVFRYRSFVSLYIHNGGYTIESLDSRNQVLTRYNFEPSKNLSGELSYSYIRKPLSIRILGEIVCKIVPQARFFHALCNPEGFGETGGFSFHIPFVKNTVAVRLRHGPKILDELRPGKQIPKIKINPVEVKELPTSGEFKFSWTASDPDGDRLYYSVHYSIDAGQSWRLSGSGLTQPALSLDISRLPKSQQTLFQVLASDGINTGVDTIGPFSVPGKIPTVAIIAPKDGSIIKQGEPIILLGSGDDPEEGNIPDARLVWSSDISGELGKGQTLQLDKGLLRGTHQIKLTARDRDGNESAADIFVEIQ